MHNLPLFILPPNLTLCLCCAISHIILVTSTLFHAAFHGSSGGSPSKRACLGEFQLACCRSRVNQRNSAVSLIPSWDICRCDHAFVEGTSCDEDGYSGRFSRRQLANVISLYDDEQFKSTILMVSL